MALESTLIQMFSQPDATLERKLIQSPEFRKFVLARWADWCLQEERILQVKECVGKDPEIARQLSPDTDWLFDRIAVALTGRDPMDNGLSKFPRTLSVSGPQWPFSPSALDHLKQRAGALTGDEWQRPIQIKPIGAGRARQIPPISAKWKIADDNDELEEDPVNPRSTR